MIPSSNFYGLLKESEFQCNITGLSKEKKLEEWFDIFKYISDSADNNPLEISSLMNNEYWSN